MSKRSFTDAFKDQVIAEWKRVARPSPLVALAETSDTWSVEFGSFENRKLYMVFRSGAFAWRFRTFGLHENMPPEDASYPFIIAAGPYGRKVAPWLTPDGRAIALGTRDVVNDLVAGIRGALTHTVAFGRRVSALCETLLGAVVQLPPPPVEAVDQMVDVPIMCMGGDERSPLVLVLLYVLLRATRADRPLPSHFDLENHVVQPFVAQMSRKSVWQGCNYGITALLLRLLALEEGLVPLAKTAPVAPPAAPDLIIVIDE